MVRRPGPVFEVLGVWRGWLVLLPRWVDPRPGYVPRVRTVEQEVVGLWAGRTGHFLMESGHHGDTWLELDGLFIRPARVARLAGELAQRISAHGVEADCGPLVGGAFLAEMVASSLDVECFYSERREQPGGGLYAVQYRVPAALRPAVRGRPSRLSMM
jgi:orotate phosphoribosyltransferase